MANDSPIREAARDVPILGTWDVVVCGEPTYCLPSRQT
jgi:hypothetical protein